MFNTNLNIKNNAILFSLPYRARVLFLVFSVIAIALSFSTTSPKQTRTEHQPLVLAHFDYIPPPRPEPKLPWQTGTIKERLKALETPLAAHQHFFSQRTPPAILDKQALNAISRAYGLPDELLFFQWHKENGGTCKKSSKKGASGCFQFLSSTAKQFNLIQDKYDFRSRPRASADTASRYLLWLLTLLYGEQADPSNWTQLRHALAAYNAGHRQVSKNGTLRIPTFTETQRYVFEIEELTTGRATLVEWGDTLDKLANRTGYSEEALLRANPTFTNNMTLKANMFLQLPDPDTGLSKVLITQGMTLYAIQRGTGASVESLLKANALKKDDPLQIGQVILIPAI